MTVEDTSDPDAAPSVDALGHDRPDAAAYPEPPTLASEAFVELSDAATFPSDHPDAPGAPCLSRLGDHRGEVPSHAVETFGGERA